MQCTPSQTLKCHLKLQKVFINHQKYHHKYQMGSGPNCPGPNCPPPKSGKLGPGQLGPGAQLSGAQLSASKKWQMCHISRANVSNIKGKLVIIVKGKCAKGKWTLAQFHTLTTCVRLRWVLAQTQFLIHQLLLVLFCLFLTKTSALVYDCFPKLINRLCLYFNWHVLLYFKIFWGWGEFALL